MTYTLTDLPSPTSPDAYADALGRMADAVAARPEVQSVYQIGGVSTPGISDLDMLVVFHDDATCTLDPLGLPGVDRSLFVHGLFGTSAAQTARARPYAPFHNVRLLRGDACPAWAAPARDSAPMRRQIALEYLLRLYASLAVQRAYGVVRVRGFLLHARAVRYDLEFLGVTAGPIVEHTAALIDCRQQWFDRAPSAVGFSALVDAFWHALSAFLEARIAPFYLPHDGPYRLGRGLTLRDAPALGHRHRGVSLPRALAGARHYGGLQRRLNRFEIRAPIQTTGLPDDVAARFRALDEVRRYNREHLPHFAGLGLSLLSI